MRFSPTNVKGDLTVWPFFETQLARGVDDFRLNPSAEIPRGEATPLKMFSFSKDFVKDWTVGFDEFKNMSIFNKICINYSIDQLLN